MLTRRPRLFSLTTQAIGPYQPKGPLAFILATILNLKPDATLLILFQERLTTTLTAKIKSSAKQYKPLGYLIALLEDEIAKEFSMSGHNAPVSIRKQTVISWLHGRQFPDASNLIRLCRALGTSTDYLLGITSYYHPGHRDELRITANPGWRPILPNLAIDRIPIHKSITDRNFRSLGCPTVMWVELYERDRCIGAEIVTFDAADTELEHGATYVVNLKSFIKICTCSLEGHYDVKLVDQVTNATYRLTVFDFKESGHYSVLGRYQSRARLAS